MKISFRRMVQADADQVERVELASFSMPWSREAFWREVANSDAYYLLAIDEDAPADANVIGYAGCWMLGDEGHITNVAIDPVYRGKGLSKLLMKAIMAAVKEHGVTAMTLEVRPSNAVAIGLYEGLGFRSVGRRPRYYQSPVEDAEIMWNTHI